MSDDREWLQMYTDVATPPRDSVYTQPVLNGQRVALADPRCPQEECLPSDRIHVLIFDPAKEPCGQARAQCDSYWWPRRLQDAILAGEADRHSK
jgi:hypothetical protein